MTKDQLLKKIENAWQEFTAAYDGLSKTQMLQPDVTGNWSVKDIIAHVTLWEGEALKHLPDIVKGKTPPKYSVTHGGIDAFNALMTERKRDLPLAEILKEQQKMHLGLLVYVSTLPDEVFATDTKARRRIRLDCYGHYPIHAKAIREWRKRIGVAEAHTK